MRVVSARRPAFRAAEIVQAHRWLQAGSSFAYRLAHLSVSRSVTVIAVALLLYLA